jgi:2-polyprenyl-6-methoxyphenol hydroxylase-like FAD-dependent oxidoreductase
MGVHRGTKSFSIVIGERGQASLSRGKGCIEIAKEKALPRSFIYFVDAKTGEKKCIPKKMPGLGFSRPLLVECLETIASESPLITIKRGNGVSHVQTLENGGLEVTLDDVSNTTLSATHVIGADGKWSSVRNSYQSLSEQGEIEECKSFGVHMMAKIPEGWKNDGTYVIRPSPECKFYVVAAPLPTGELSISMVCYKDTLERYSFLEPPKYENGKTWEGEYSALPSTEASNRLLSEQLADLFEKELPAFYKMIGSDAFNTARVNRYVSWFHIKGDVEDVSYSTSNGKVTLIGDAAHAITPSLGEGCNTAMESATKLIDSVVAEMKRLKTSQCTSEILSKAFINYGTSRPKDTIPIQQKSAAASNTMR